MVAGYFFSPHHRLARPHVLNAMVRQVLSPSSVVRISSRRNAFPQLPVRISFEDTFYLSRGGEIRLGRSLRNSSGNLAMFAAIRRASSLLSNLAARKSADALFIGAAVALANF